MTENNTPADMISIPMEEPWNVKCCICGNKWHTKGELAEDLNCSRCADADMLAKMTTATVIKQEFIE